MRKIAVVTGTRAEYGLLKSAMKAIQAHPKLELSLIVTGMHLSEEFGYTIKDIENDGFHIDARVKMLPDNDTQEAMARSIGLGIIGMSQVWQQLRPDIVLVLGDRVEPLASTISATYMNIPVAHIHGGDVSGNIDDSIRHAITQLAHIHFPVTQRSADRIINMGEEEWRVHMVGSPPFELSESNLSEPVILVLQHPVTGQVDEAADQMRETMEAVMETGYPVVAIYPNSDAGGRSMIDVIKEYDGTRGVKSFKSLPRDEFLSLMKSSGVMVGNSSCGIMEAPALGIPVVNIGIRQQGRERGKNVIDVGHDRHEILKALEKAMHDEEFIKEVRECESPYRNNGFGQRIAGILADIEITPQFLQRVRH